MTLLHIVLLIARKSAEETLSILKFLLDHGCKEVINTPDSLGNTPLHALIVRYITDKYIRIGQKLYCADDLQIRFRRSALRMQPLEQMGRFEFGKAFVASRSWSVHKSTREQRTCQHFKTRARLGRLLRAAQHDAGPRRYYMIQ